MDDDKLFAEVMTAVLKNPEIKRALDALARDSGQPHDQVVTQLRAHARDLWPELRSHTSVETMAAAHAAAEDALQEFLNGVPEVRAARRRREAAEDELAAVKARLDRAAYPERVTAVGTLVAAVRRLVAAWWSDSTRERAENVLHWTRRQERLVGQKARENAVAAGGAAPTRVFETWLDLVQVAAKQAVLPIAREWVSDQLAELRLGLYRLDFDNVDTDGARQMVAPEHEVPTSASQRLVAMMRQVGGGSIGVSGPRGVGKSTLIEAVCENREWVRSESGHVGLFVPAPAEYVPREFLLHLFAQLCLKTEPAAAEEPPERESPRSTSAAVLALGVAALVGGLALLVPTLKPPAGDSVPIGLGIVVCAGLAGLVTPTRLPRLFLAPFAVLVAAAIAVGLAPAVKSGISHTDPALLALAPAAAALLAMAVWWSPLPAGLAGASVGLAAVGVDAFATVGAPEGLLVQVGFFGVASVFMLLAPHLRAVPPRFVVNVVGAAVVVAAGIGAAAMWKIAVPPVLLAGGLLAIVGATTIRMSAPPGQPRPRTEPESVAETRALLARIRYQSTITTGWTDAVKLGAIGSSPLAVERGSTGGTSQTRAPWTYPEIVADFRAYVNRFVGRGTPLVIGIDELDKLSFDAASRFLNDIKAVFDNRTARCHYLISVSEEALAGFEQRGLVVRDVFDTAFDEMLRVEPLSVAEAVSILNKRVIGLPRGVVALCHALAGGLPRELVRMLRAVVAARGDERSIPLGGLAELVCEQEMLSRVHGLRVECRKLPDWRDAADLWSWASGLTAADAASITTVPERLALRRDSTALSLYVKHACAHYHLVTVVQFFQQADSDVFERAETSRDGVALLAEARAELGGTWAHSWQLISAFRTAWTLPVLDLPETWMPQGEVGLG